MNLSLQIWLLSQSSPTSATPSGDRSDIDPSGCSRPNHLLLPCSLITGPVASDPSLRNRHLPRARPRESANRLGAVQDLFLPMGSKDSPKEDAALRDAVAKSTNAGITGQSAGCRTVLEDGRGARD
eukprot:gene4614-biopygen761